MEYILVAIIAVLFLYIVYTDSQRTKERRELLDRIMAKDYQEYQLEQSISFAPPKGRNKLNSQRDPKGKDPEDLSQYYK